MNRANQIFWSITLAIITLGFISPFIDRFTIIQVFFLTIPFAIIFLISILIVIIGLISKGFKFLRKPFVKYFLIIPIFIVSQIVSILIVREIQLFRINENAKELNEIKSQTNDYPFQFEKGFGLNYKRFSENEFELSFDGGFLVREIYNSKTKETERFGWND